MGKRGPKPLPSNVRRITGNARHRPFNKDEPEPEIEIPDAPAELTAEAAKYWPDYAEILVKMGVLTAADSTALALLCEHTATWFACINQTREEGVIADRSMNPEKQRFGRNPIYEEALKAGQQMERLLIEFGLTPSSRTRVRRA